MKNTENWKKQKGYAFLLAAIATVQGCGKFKENTQITDPYNPGIIWADSNKREYAGLVKHFRGGSQQKVYVDRMPFGNLDGVRELMFLDNGQTYEMERHPRVNEEDTFLLLEDMAKTERPLAFTKEELSERVRLRKR